MADKTINEAASRLLTNSKIVARVAELREPAVKAARLEIEETLRQAACVLRSDARKLYRPDGSLRPVQEIDDDTAAAIASIEHDKEGRVTKIRLWDKNVALNMAMKHLGLFKEDNTQHSPNLALQVVLVQPKPRSEMED